MKGKEEKDGVKGSKRENGKKMPHTHSVKLPQERKLRRRKKKKKVDSGKR